MDPKLTINLKEAQYLLGRGKSSTQTLMARIRMKYGKDKYQPITVKEFCNYTGISKDDVQSFFEK